MPDEERVDDADPSDEFAERTTQLRDRENQFDASVKQFLEAFAGTSPDESAYFVAALRATALEEVLGAVVGDEPIPSSVSELRSLRLRRISANLGRTLTEAEIAAVFRIPHSSAGSLARRMEASYPQVVSTFRKGAVKRSIEKIDLPNKPDADSAEVRLHFRWQSGSDAAREILGRVSGTASVRYEGRLVVLPVGGSPEDTYAHIRDTLGLQDELENARKSGQNDGASASKRKRSR